jgi:hypothetical protein
MTQSYGKGARFAALGLAAAVALSLAAPSFAGEKPAAPTVHGAGSGVMAAIDPATGKLRQPTAAESKALVAGIRSMFQPFEALQAKSMPDGTMSVDLGTAFLNISVAQVGPDGVVHQVCVDNSNDANALLNAAPAFEDK